MKYFLIYIYIINLVLLIMYGLDKFFAMSNKRRIREKTLFFVALISGGLGAILGMFIFKHKTKKIKFYIFNIGILILWCYFIYKYLK